MFFFLAENNPEHLFNPAGHTRWAGFLHQELAKPSGLYYVLRQTKSVHKEEVSGIKLVLAHLLSEFSLFAGRFSDGLWFEFSVSVG